MTEFGAQLSSISSSGGEGSPSIFEVLAQESLFSTLQPALKHILRIAAGRNPQHYGQLFVYCDELYSALQLIIETYYLKNYNASFSENFYGLRRVACIDSDSSRHVVASSDSSPVTHLASCTSLTRSERLHSLLFLVVVPYVKNKCEHFFESVIESVNTRNSSRPSDHQGLQDKVYAVFVSVYPVLHALWELTALYYQLAYMFGVVQCHSPLLRLARLTLRHLTDDEITACQQKSTPLTDLLHNKTLTQRLLIVLSRVLSLVSVVLSTGLSVGVFFLQFLDWWYSSDQRVSAVNALPNPKPPKKTAHEVSRMSNVCPLCNKLCTNSTVLAVSGFVFCYPCIVRFVKDKSCCPVTGYPAHIDQLIRLYQSDTDTTVYQSDT